MFKNAIMNGHRTFLREPGGPKGTVKTYQEMVLALIRDGSIELAVDVDRAGYDSREWVGWNHAPWRSTLLTMADGETLIGAALIVRIRERVYRIYPFICPEGGLFAASPECVEIDMDAPGGPEVLSSRGQATLDERDQKTLNAVSFYMAIGRCDNIERRKVAGAKNERSGGAALLDKERFPRFEHYVLEIKRTPEDETETDENGEPGAPKRLHLCRGHWSVYTPERPLFGRYVGKYWIPDHKRGDADLGQVFKDYKINGRDGHVEA